MKLDLGFELDNAGWSAFVVDASGIVRQANQAAVQTFGTVMEGEPALSASIWTPDNDLMPFECVGVECVKRLTQLKHDVVCDVRDVVDGADTENFQPIFKPVW